ncbi:MAG: ImmA/IrrE family metallo-endopeptidase [Dehalococcoidia bacterium]|nr:ImmA/IrrE family metallo-endopeptidase [Dehalococcoidia bacterium]
MSGKEIAQSTRRRCNTNDPEIIASREGLEIIETYLPERWWDILLCDCVAIRENLVPKWQRWCIAHCLGHHFMHHGNQLRLREWTELITERKRQEAEAETFAAWLLIPEDELMALKESEGENLNTWTISEHFQVPNEIVPFRLGMGDNQYLKSIGW